jgi:glycyl-tRNA synthetase beta chain
MRVIIECELDLNLQSAIEKALSLQPLDKLDGELAADVYQYAMERLRAYYLEESGSGITSDMFEAVLAKQPASPLDFHQRLGAVRAFSAMAEAQSLAAANKRVSNILRKSDDPVRGAVDPGLFQLEEERLLFQGLESLGAQVEPLLSERRYTEALSALAALRVPVDAFFDKVMVMDPDPALRANRLALLGTMQKLFLFIADLSLLKAGE